MSNIFKIAVRNVLRNRRRSLLTLMAIGMGVMLSFTYNGTMKGMVRDMINNTINMQTGHLQVHTKGYMDREYLLPLDLLISDPDLVKETIEEVAEVEEVVSRIEFYAMLTPDRENAKNERIAGVGIQPAAEKRISSLIEIVEGNYLTEDGEEILIGRKLAEKADLEVGDSVILLGQSVWDAISAIRLKVVGIYKVADIPQYEENFAFIPISRVQQLLDMEDKVTEISVKLVDGDRNEAIAESLGEKLQQKGMDLEVHTWQQLNPALVDYIKIITPFLVGLIGIIVILVAGGILNTMLMAFLERLKEIGMMKAMGVRSREIMALFMTEAAIIGFVGAVIGGILGSAVVLYFQIYGFSMEMWADYMEGFPVLTIRGLFSWPTLLSYILLGIVVSLLSTLYPAYLASKLEPAEALRRV